MTVADYESKQDEKPGLQIVLQSCTEYERRIPQASSSWKPERTHVYDTQQHMIRLEMYDQGPGIRPGLGLQRRLLVPRYVTASTSDLHNIWPRVGCRGHKQNGGGGDNRLRFACLWTLERLQ
uniref:Uncharacterized protein n=1 Tax=Knipowitschia caucasica TaxID=637954 RepID=A0AAV2L3L2_KNICA